MNWTVLLTLGWVRQGRSGGEGGMVDVPYVTVNDLCETVVTVIGVEVEGLCFDCRGTRAKPFEVFLLEFCEWCLFCLLRY